MPLSIQYRILTAVGGPLRLGPVLRRLLPGNPCIVEAPGLFWLAVRPLAATIGQGCGQPSGFAVHHVVAGVDADHRVDPAE